MSEKADATPVELSLSQLLSQRCVAFATSSRPQEIIDAGVESLFKELVKDAFRSYGDFGKATEKAFKNALPANVSDLVELGRYNTLVKDALRRKWEESGVADDMVRKAEEALADVLKDGSVPSHVKLSDLLHGFVEVNKEEAFEDGWETPDFRLEDENKFIHFYFDKRPRSEDHSRYSSERSKYELDNRLAGSNRDGEELDGYPVYTIYSATLGGEAIPQMLNLRGARDKWEKCLVALYYGQAKLVLDCDPDDYGYPSQYD